MVGNSLGRVALICVAALWCAACGSPVATDTPSGDPFADVDDSGGMVFEPDVHMDAGSDAPVSPDVPDAGGTAEVVDAAGAAEVADTAPAVDQVAWADSASAADQSDTPDTPDTPDAADSADVAGPDMLADVGKDLKEGQDVADSVDTPDAGGEVVADGFVDAATETSSDAAEDAADDVAPDIASDVQPACAVANCPIPGNPCKVAACLPDETCGYDDVIDGTPCGGASVCVAGSCMVADGLPTGTIAYFHKGACPLGWEPAWSAVGRTLVPTGVQWVGQTDGQALQDAEDRTHVHDVLGTLVAQAVSFVGIAGCCNNGCGGAQAWTVSGQAAAATSGLPYAQLLVCRKSSAMVVAGIPDGVFFFADGQQCAPPMVGVSAASDRFVVANPAGGTVGAAFGGSSATHAHTVDATFELPGYGIGLASGCCGGGYAKAGATAFAGKSADGNVNFPSLRLRLCESSISPVAGPTPVPPGIVAFTGQAQCPTGWTEPALLQGRLLVGTATAQSVGVHVGVAMTDAEDRTHTHPLALSVQPIAKAVSGSNGGNTQASTSQAVTTTGTSAPATSGLAFVQWRACQKD